MGRNQRTAAIDYSLAVRFEGVGGVVQSDVEKYLQEKIGAAIQNPFQARIIDHAPAFHETAAKNALVAFIELLPVTDDITTIVGFIRHHNYHGVTLHFVQASNNRSAEAKLRRVLNWG